ncbi:ThiF family adenylyltransferase [Desertibacillus haloalkaliphilus]|uniref:ThiF family adenylyltransferase n=1 Tax=Desertibacillus haloalkaliphilus TaxID=1328930 RepID=UPI001C25A897|nr:ThiF family adenylyltransferase [Desertibacillus haloalkaliphilus]MBU8906034.1 ThiF family adenylyltransferase [Desertibacillus haloalkaliphilus]
MNRHIKGVMVMLLSRQSTDSKQVFIWPELEKDRKLLGSKTVTIIGVGALGTVAAHHFVRTGVGNIRLVDRDFVEESNLQRQMLFDENDVKANTPKVIAAKKKLERINSNVTIVSLIQDVNATTIEEIVEGSDVIIDATDNMETRFLINDVSVKHDIPWIYGGAIHTRGMFFSVIPGHTPCLRCLFPTSSQNHGETCDTVGVLGPLVHIIASYQVTEALKILLDYKQNRNRHLNQLETWEYDFDGLPIEHSRNPNCECCVERTFNYLNQQSNQLLISQLCGRDSIQITPTETIRIDLKAWAKKWRPLGDVTCTPFLLRLHYQNYQLTLFQDGRLLIKGTEDEREAKKLYSNLVGN